MLRRLFCLFFILALFLPTLQYTFGLLPNNHLAGAEEIPPRPHWSVSGWLDGSYQSQYAKRRAHKLGLRAYFIRTYNQLHYTLFGRVISNAGTNVVIGRKKWLYEKVYVDKLNTATHGDGSYIDARVQQLRRLQDRLEEMGIAFAFILAPSKAEVYPEYIPEALRKKSLPPGTATDYLQARDALRRHGVNLVDGHTLFLEEKKNKEYQLFGPSGVHWNKYGAYLAWKNLAPLVNERIRVPLLLPPLERVESRPSEPVEADLGGLLNLWDPGFTSRTTDYPVFVHHHGQEGSEKPSILIIGDSFLFTLVDIVARAELSREVDAWYYFKRQFSYPAAGKSIDLYHPIDTIMQPGTIDWQKRLFAKDLVVLVATEYWLPELGFGFIEGALEALERLPEQ